MTCPSCGGSLEEGFLHVRGLGAALHWSADGRAPFWSRRGLEQIRLDQVSVRGTGGQAVLPARRCANCARVTFATTGDAGEQDR